jgi:hypothetical protein
MCDKKSIKLLIEWRDYYWRRYLRGCMLSHNRENEILASAFDMAAKIIRTQSDVNVTRKGEIDERLSEFKDYKYGQFPDE